MKVKAINPKVKWEEFFIETYNQLPIVIDYGKGSCVFDVEGRRYIDFSSGIGVSSLGHQNEKLTKALHNQLDNIIHVSNTVFNKPLLDAGEKIIEASKMHKVFFANSGTEANECAIKIARKYGFDKYGEDRNVIISLKDAFHGRTIAALMATPNEKYQKGFFPNHDGFKYIEKNNIEDLKSNIDKSVCAIMLEVIQGESGVYPLNKEFIKEIEKICNEKDIVLICDEVQSGIGRSGKLFAYEHFNIKPDIVTIAKGLGGGVPVGGVLANEKLSSTFKKGSHGSTFGGNPLAMTATCTVLDEVESQGFYEEVEKKGNVIMSYIKDLNKESILDIRGYGLMIGIETNLEISEVQNKALEKGILVLTAGKDVIRLLPPLTISYDEIYEGLGILKECF